MSEIMHKLEVLIRRALTAARSRARGNQPLHLFRGALSGQSVGGVVWVTRRCWFKSYRKPSRSTWGHLWPIRQGWQVSYGSGVPAWFRNLRASLRNVWGLPHEQEQVCAGGSSAVEGRQGFGINGTMLIGRTTGFGQGDLKSFRSFRF